MGMRIHGQRTLTALSLAVAGYALVVYALLPVGAAVHPDMRAGFALHRTGIYLHVFAALFALALGPFQFSARLRARRPGLHRAMGRLYLGVGVLLGGLAGLYLSLHAYGGVVARAGFACLALAWLYTGARAFLAVRSRRFEAHRRWMIRNFALSFAAVMLRLWIPASALTGVPFESAYPVIAWMCWLPNLAAAELLLGRRAESGAATIGEA